MALAGPFYYVRPDENWAFDGAVAGGAATDYLDEWLVDGRWGRPVRATSGTIAWTVTNPSAEVGIVAMCNHNVSVNGAITGSVSGTLTAPALPPNGIRINPWVAVTPTATTTLTLTITGNSADVIIGELIAGKMRTLSPGASVQNQNTRYDDFFAGEEGEFGSIPPYDRGLTRRAFDFTQYYTGSQLDDILAWRDAQRAGSRPSLIVPDSTKNDAWLVRFSGVSHGKASAIGVYEVDLEFIEYPRSRW